MASEFKLYPEEQHWWSFNDHRAVLAVMRRLKPARVLEFGPGSSTLALIEGGASHVDTCEDDPHWAEVYEDRLVRKYPDVVSLHRYTWQDPLTIPAIDDQRYDLALVDGPRDDAGESQRFAVVRYAVERCKAVLVPSENRNMRVLLEAHAHLSIEVMETGPLAGSFILLQQPGGPRMRAALASMANAGAAVAPSPLSQAHSPESPAGIMRRRAPRAAPAKNDVPPGFASETKDGAQ